MTVKDIFNFLNSLYPVKAAMDFDNVGILIGNPESNVSKALVVLDCTLEAVKIAKDNGCQLIVSHHPVIFSPLKTILKGSVQYEIIKNDLSVISMHTNLDTGLDGVNDVLCEVLGVENASSLPVSDGFTIKKGVLPSVSANCLAKAIKERLGGGVKYVDGGRKITNVLVCGGSGGNYIEDAISGGYDALITADVKHHHFLIAYDNNISLFDAGHFNTEDVVIDPLKQKLQKEFNDCNFLTFHPEIIKFE
jgi:dinuclear metal center YbgI/SA1388 family protein